MSERLVELALPRTDAGVVVQAVIAVVVLGAALWRVRRHPELRTFVIGCATLTLALFGLRALH